MCQQYNVGIVQLKQAKVLLDNSNFIEIQPATIILISDFGAEGRTDKMTVSEIQKLVERDSLNFWMHSKQTHLVRRI